MPVFDGFPCFGEDSLGGAEGFFEGGFDWWREVDEEGVGSVWVQRMRYEIRTDVGY